MWNSEILLTIYINDDDDDDDDVLICVYVECEQN